MSSNRRGRGAVARALDNWDRETRDGRDWWSTRVGGWCPVVVAELPGGWQGFLAVVDGELLECPAGPHRYAFASALEAAHAAARAARDRSAAGDTRRHYPGAHGNGADFSDHDAVVEAWCDALTCARPAFSPVPPRPAPLDVRAMSPALRAMPAAEALRLAALAVVANADALRRWLRTNWCLGPDADLSDPNHPARVAARDPSSPTPKLVDAHIELSEACQRYRDQTGRDGVALATQHIVQFWDEAADILLKPLVQDATEHGWYGPRPGGRGVVRPPAPKPTPAQWQAAFTAYADWILSEPDIGGLADQLRVLLEACRAGGGDPHEPGTAAAIQGVGTAVAGALRRECPQDLLETALDAWAAGTGGPKITLVVDDQPSAHPSTE
jgi:hypothetical protein